MPSAEDCEEESPRHWCLRAMPLDGMAEPSMSHLRRGSGLLRIGDLHCRICILSAAALLVLFLIARDKVGVSQLQQGVLPNWVPAAVIAVFVLWLMISSFMIYAARPHLRALICKRRGQICPFCYYDLSARPHGDTTCSECGRYTPRRECVRIWCKLVRHGV